ncbi:MAG: anti sigma factor C-terminal domain-containing protein [Clostridia bacterium]|nr:anti sigma factor C-terminal domain-containing protein [Clostridia bacterium]
MKYSELIEKYEKGELNETEAGEVERDIEKHEAISDYLAEREDIPELEMLRSNGNKGEAAQNDGAADFTKKIKRQIRRAFLKAGLITGLLVLGIVLFCTYALPKIVDRLNYDPTEIVGMYKDSDGKVWDQVKTNRISRDIAVYSELLLPAGFRELVSAESSGYGRYSICVHQNFANGGSFRDVAGVIDRGKLTLYDPNLIKLPVMNLFDTVAAGVHGGVRVSFEGLYGLDYALNGAKEGEQRVIYVTFNRPMDYDEVIAWCERNDVSAMWGAVCTGDEVKTSRFFGARFALTSVMQGFDDEKYPYLSVYSLSEAADRTENYAGKELMTKHIVSLLNWFSDNRSDMKLFYPDAEVDSVADGMRESAEYIAENGFSVYGIALTGDAETIERLYGLEGVAYMFSEGVN